MRVPSCMIQETSEQPVGKLPAFMHNTQCISLLWRSHQIRTSGAHTTQAHLLTVWGLEAQGPGVSGLVLPEACLLAVWTPSFPRVLTWCPSVCVCPHLFL